MTDPRYATMSYQRCRKCRAYWDGNPRACPACAWDRADAIVDSWVGRYYVRPDGTMDKGTCIDDLLATAEKSALTRMIQAALMDAKTEE